MKVIFSILFLVTSYTASASSCDIAEYIRSVDGQEKLTSLTERAKSLIISKLEDLGIEENQVKIKAQLPNTAKKIPSTITVSIKSKSLRAEGSSFTFLKVLRDEDCGLEVIIQGGRLLNQENGKDFGSLGKVKEFIKII